MNRLLVQESLTEKNYEFVVFFFLCITNERTPYIVYISENLPEIFQCYGKKKLQYTIKG